MEKKQRKEELQSRREFFKKATQKTIPIIGLMLLSSPVKLWASSISPCDCARNCKGDCESDCGLNCASGCYRDCSTDCKGSCYKGCKTSCDGSCTDSCKHHLR